MNTTNDVTTITSKDLPKLRADIAGYAADMSFGDAFRAACLSVLAAIDQARDDDAATHGVLENSLKAFVVAGNAEVDRGRQVRDLFNQVCDGDGAEAIRIALIKLIPLLPEIYILMAFDLLAGAIAIEADPTIDFGLADWPADSDRLH
ncbi:MAG: hypothetical protein Q8J72_12675 [Rhodocyclaceae bacterium]|nr:hypothetical protein [Rhodocyclaceae bacterium]